MIENHAAPTLTIPEFSPDDLEVADIFPEGPEPVDPEAPAVIRVGLNSADLAYVYLAIDPAGEAVLARLGVDFRFTNAIWLDLRPAEALELGTRLRICAEAAARFAEACAAGPDEADGADDRPDDPSLVTS